VGESCPPDAMDGLNEGEVGLRRLVPVPSVGDLVDGNGKADVVSCKGGADREAMVILVGGGAKPGMTSIGESDRFMAAAGGLGTGRWCRGTEIFGSTPSLTGCEVVCIGAPCEAMAASNCTLMFRPRKW
jgi:hypothetical protein